MLRFLSAKDLVSIADSASLRRATRQGGELEASRRINVIMWRRRRF